MSSSLTIKEALAQATNSLNLSDSPVLDSEVLLSYTLKKERSYFRAWPDNVLTYEELRPFLQLIEQRKAGHPIAYLTGEREFWSRSFKVTPDVLIPRPDTELLIEIIQQHFSAEQTFSILDLGTGSGAIAITLALEFQHSAVTAIDSSNDALLIAQENANTHNVKNINFIRSDWFKQVPNICFDLIVSNPPYICQTDSHLFEGDVRFEPRAALIAENEGLQDYERILSCLSTFLKPNGIVLFEHGYQQGIPVKNLLESSGFKSTEQFSDIQGHIRATLGKNHNFVS